MKIENVDNIPEDPRSFRLKALREFKPGETKCYTPEKGDKSARSLAASFQSAKQARPEFKNFIIARRQEKVYVHRPEEKA